MPSLDMYKMREPVEWNDDIDKAKRTGKGVTVAEVAERCSDAKAAGANIRPSSPRSTEAFLRSGFDPDDLVYKPLSYFKAKTNDEELAQLAFDFFEKGRQQRLEDLRTMRQSLIDDGWKPGDTIGAAGATQAGKASEGNTEDMVERERKRLEVLRTRQKRELDQLVEYEVKRAQIQGKAEAKLAKQEERAEAQRRAREEKEKAWRIALREQELKRLAAEREEEAANKRADQERFKKEQEFLAREQAKEKELRKEAYKKEQERIEKSEQARQETERILEQQQKQVEARKREMARRDAERAAVKAEKQKILAAENEEKRKQAAQRLKAAYDTNVALLAHKRQAFDARERANTERRNKQAEDRAAQEVEKKLAAQAQAEKRKGVYQHAIRQQEETVAAILAQEAKRETNMQREAERRKRELSKAKLERQLNMEARMEAVCENRKKDFYHREQLLQKIMAETDRVMSMLRDRAALQRQRRDANMQASQARQKMVETMERLQHAKKFDKIASGEVNLESLMR